MNYRIFFKAGIGNVVYIVLSVLCFPFLTRLYAPDQFVPWAVGLAAVMLIASMTTLRFELAMTLERSHTNASSIFWLCLIISLSIYILVFISIEIFMIYGWVYQDSTLKYFSLLIQLWLLLVILNIIFNGWLMHHGAFTSISFSMIINGVIVNSFQIFGGIFSEGNGFWLVAGSISGQLGMLVLMLVVSLKILQRPIKLTSALSRIPTLAWKHRNFALYSLPYTFFNALRDRLPVVIVSLYSPPIIAGLYSQAWRLSNLPIGLIGGGVRPVLFHAAASNGLSAIETPIRRIIFIIVTLGSPGVALVTYLPSNFYATVFGDAWRDVGPIFSCLVFPAVLFSISSWMDRLLDTAGRQQLNLWTQISVSITSLLALVLILAYGIDLYWAVATQSAILALNYMLVIYLTFQVAGYRLNFLLYMLIYAIGLFSVFFVLLNFAR